MIIVEIAYWPPHHHTELVSLTWCHLKLLLKLLYFNLHWIICVYVNHYEKVNTILYMYDFLAQRDLGPKELLHSPMRWGQF